MKLLEIRSQNRRDFYAHYKCENCKHLEINVKGYDDANYHDNVIPNMKCPKCGESTNSLGIKYEPMQTKYPEGYQI